MNGYSYNGAYTGNAMDHTGNQQDDDMMMMMASGNLGVPTAMGGQSLDDIVSQNAKMIRRQSMPQGYGTSPNHMDADMRRVSMMDHGNGSPAVGFQYDPNANMDHTAFASGAVTPRQAGSQQRHSQDGHRPSTADLSLSTSFPRGGSQSYMSSVAPTSAYATSPAHPAANLDMAAMESSYVDSHMSMNMDMGVDQNLNASMDPDPMQMHLYNQAQFNQSAMSSPMHQAVQPQGTPRSGRMSSHDAGGNGMQHQYGSQNSTPNAALSRQLSRPRSLHVPDASPAHTASPLSAPPSGGPRQQRSQGFTPHLNRSGSSVGFQRQPQNPVPGSSQDRPINAPTSDQGYQPVGGPLPTKPSEFNPNNQGFPWEHPEGGWPSTMVNKPHMNSVYKNAYSSTGFDMLGVLMRVATRPNPEINIGSVDLSCAFVVCDAEKDDFPIVYCSDNFERLTGYTKHMILGRNCRFLQSPDGNVAPGIKRKYVDDDSVLYLKNMINLRREAQISLINYRRGGQPFMNLLTMIPISWDTDQVKFFVGFQVDLVEQPNAVTNKNPDGSFSINYQRGMTMPRYVMNAPDTSQKSDLGQTVPRDDVSAILSTIGSGESEYAKRMWDKVLLENTDDVVHVLSLKGLFQWVSPSALRILEYEPSEIVGTALSSVCHPSDIVPVTRELKDTSTGAAVNVVFRIRRKNSGYMWFEGHGSLHTEQGKGRKSIIMVGRERPVYTLSKNDITKAGGIGENELWTKLSTSGMFLFVSSNVRQLLDRQPDELIGVSIQSLMRTDSKQEFARILELARTGKKASVKHEMINRRGQVLSAFTTLYPGDAVEGQKPTFIVAQTRLIKFSRGNHANRPPIYSKGDRNSSESNQSGVAGNNQAIVHEDNAGATPNSGGNSARYMGTDGSAATYAGQQGLPIGRQDHSLASDDNLFDELKTTKSSSWQYEIRQLEKRNRLLAEEVQSLIAAKKKRKRRKGAGNQQKDCANCHTRVTPEWRRGPSGQRDLCNSCGLRWAKLNGRVSPRTSSQHSGGAASDRASKASASPRNSIPPSAVKTESPNDPSGSGNMGDSSRSTPVQKAMQPMEGHSATMEGASGVPDKIDEGIEPD
ncbi:blue-light-activated transcription factor [Lecanosticta acicola]|uniref:Blue-light-activated transcription factor n=1 Tax=Lecanosticta acicola TaxID=111012 RepID=A0AAI9EA63_9PEZI|nr:blue-light-activated transcription factor [Lecanosticta acicola]